MKGHLIFTFYLIKLTSICPHHVTETRYKAKSVFTNSQLTIFCIVPYIKPYLSCKIHKKIYIWQYCMWLCLQFTLSFLDECDKMKVLMHLHSFTYDYHLRTLALFTANQDSVLRPGYHVTNFLDDFLKYYSKAPNYAYCLAHSGRYLKDLVTPLIYILLWSSLGNETQLINF